MLIHIHILLYIQTNLPTNTSIERISEGVETNEFRSQFFSWPVVVNIPKGIAFSKDDQPVRLLHRHMYAPLSFMFCIRFVPIRII